MDYQDANAKLTGRNSQRRKLENNTYLERRGENIAVKLHATDIITYLPNGEVVLSAGGCWRTVTTKSRMNQFLPYGFGIAQRKGQWYVERQVENYQWAPLALFEEGIVLHADGAVTGGSPLVEERGNIKQRRAAKKYAKAYIEAFRAGKVPAPGNGDCWGCLMVDAKTRVPAMGGHEHILSHIEEKYYVPSLLVRAVETFGASLAAKDTIYRTWQRDLTNRWGDSIYQQLEKLVYRYCLRELGQAS